MRAWKALQVILYTLFFVSSFTMVAGFWQTVNSPDERANLLVATAFAERSEFFLVESRNVELQGVLHPRSFFAKGEQLFGRSFLGLPVLAGLVAKAMGSYGVFFVTPVLALLAVIAWRSTINTLSKNQLFADFAALALLAHPAFWYYSGRVMMHNVGFLALLIISFWAVVVNPFKKWKEGMSWMGFVLSGALFALALAFRASEVIWLLPLVLVLFALARKQLSPKLIFAWCIGALIVGLPFAYLQNNLYGAPWNSGYQVQADAPAIELSTTSLDPQPEPHPIVKILLPFGFAERAILRHAWQYGIALYPWMSLLAFAGIGMWLFDQNKKELFPWKKWMAVSTAVSAWLVVVYGSWTFHDNPDPNIFTLGNSYARYWLPVFLLATPFVALPLETIASWFKKKPAQQFAAIILALVVIAPGAWLVFYGHDGFIPTRAALASFEEKREFILANTDQEAVVITDRSDKFIFPDRAVVVPLRSEVTYASLPAMLRTSPVYYFGITLPEKDVQYLNEEKLRPDGIRIEYIGTWDDESLYRFTLSP